MSLRCEPSSEQVMSMSEKALGTRIKAIERACGQVSPGIKSPLSIALICTRGRRIPASASTNEGPAKGDLIRLRSGVCPSRSYSQPVLERLGQVDR